MLSFTCDTVKIIIILTHLHTLKNILRAKCIINYCERFFFFLVRASFCETTAILGYMFKLPNKQRDSTLQRSNFFFLLEYIINMYPLKRIKNSMTDNKTLNRGQLTNVPLDLSHISEHWVCSCNIHMH